jgi:outer membrane protein OmpA-like peptidoglycan-associated protein
MNRILRKNAISWLVVLVVIPFVAGCAWRGPIDDEGYGYSGGDGQVYVEADVTQDEFDSLEGRVSDLETRVTANENLAEQANATAEKALKCCRKDYTIILTEEIYFDFNQFSIRAADEAALDRVAGKLKADPDLIAEISGHTDGVGTTDYNIVLGQKRADAARQYLISKHQLNLSRLAIRTFGKDAPIATNDAETGRSKNRRVTIDVLGFAP